MKWNLNKEKTREETDVAKLFPSALPVISFDISMIPEYNETESSTAWENGEYTSEGTLNINLVSCNKKKSRLYFPDNGEKD